MWMGTLLFGVVYFRDQWPDRMLIFLPAKSIVCEHVPLSRKAWRYQRFSSACACNVRLATSCSKTKMEEQVTWEKVLHWAWNKCFCNHFWRATFPDTFFLFTGDRSARSSLQTVVRSHWHSHKECRGKSALYVHQLPWLSHKMSIPFRTRECKCYYNPLITSDVMNSYYVINRSLCPSLCAVIEGSIDGQFRARLLEVCFCSV